MTFMVRKASGAYHKIAFFARRAKKLAYQRFNPSLTEPIPLFLVGCQRSGTNMVMDVLDRSWETWTYNEADHSPAFNKYRIRPNVVLNELLRKARARYVVFKPLCDSQWTDRLLSMRPSAKAIWLYRGYLDVAGSAERHWGTHQKEVIGRIANGQIVTSGSRAERIAAEQKYVLKQLYSPAMSNLSGAALIWYVRNQFFFDLALEHREDVLLVKYEDLVLKPREAFLTLFQYLGASYKEKFTKKISCSSVGRCDKSHLPAEIKNLCEAMLGRLDTVYLSQRKKLRQAIPNPQA